MKLFETFAGIGAQHQALHNLKEKNIIKNFNVCGISEWYIAAIISYAHIHYPKEMKEFCIDNYTNDFIIDTLSKKPYCFSLNSKTPIKSLKSLKKETLRELYKAVVISKNKGSIVEINGNDLDNDIDVLSYSFHCFVEGTLVLTESGFKPIETINVGEKVLTHTNEYQKVLKTMVNNTSTIFSLETPISEIIETTKEHPFYVRKKNSTKKWIEAKDLKEGDYLGLALNKNEKLPLLKSNLNDFISHNSFWWIIGLLLNKQAALIDNIFTQNNVKVSFTIKTSKKKEIKKIEEKIKELHFEYDTYTTTNKEKTTYFIGFYSFECIEFIKEIQNNYAIILDLPKEILKKVIKGYLFLENCEIELTKSYKIVIEKREFAYTFAHCMAKAYQKPFSMKLKDKKFILKFKLKPLKEKETFFEDNYMWFPLKSITNTKRNEYVYNLEVENDNSYTVFNIVCHNCQDLSQAGKRAGMSKGSDTRSGLLWQILRILEEKNSINPLTLPKVLLMENVTAIYNSQNKKDLEIYLEDIKKLGYSSDCLTLNVKDFGIPQNRNRAFILSYLEKEPKIRYIENIYEYLNKEKIKPPLLGKYLNWDINNSNPLFKDEELKAIPKKTQSRINMMTGKKWEVDGIIKSIKPCSHLTTTSTHVQCLTTKQDRVPNSGIVMTDDFFRFLSPRECFLLMGFSNENYNEVGSFLSTEHAYKLAGNSIGVNVLEILFEHIKTKLLKD